MSHAGWLAGFQFQPASAWRRCVAARRALDSGRREAIRPSTAISTIFSSQNLNRTGCAVCALRGYWLSASMTDVLRLRRRSSGRKFRTFRSPFAGLSETRCRGVSGQRIVFQNSRADHSSTGATARRQVLTLSDGRTATMASLGSCHRVPRRTMLQPRTKRLSSSQGAGSQASILHFRSREKYFS